MPPRRAERAETTSTAAVLIPDRPTLKTLRARAAACTACPLYRHATQTVFGEGPADAAVMFVGEVPGDKEDIAGHPFVGPAGQLLDRCMDAAGIDRGKAYVTNVVKHFKWEQAGKRRLHKRPNAGEIEACKPWLEAELAVVQPKALVCLGATAAQALLGRDFRITRSRGAFLKSNLAPHVTATVHPSSLLRTRDDREREIERFIADLRKVAALGL
jgi:DNA polymerase